MARLFTLPTAAAILAARKLPPDLAATDAAIARLGFGGREDAEAVKRLGAAAQSLRTTPGG